MFWEQFTDIDQGLEKIPEQFKKKAWEQVKQELLLKKKPDYQKLFKKYYNCLREHENLSVSSQAEAYRLFVAEQIKNHLFLAPEKNNYNWSHLSKDLIDNLENNFQNHSRPIVDPENSTKENLELILKYYFPDTESQKSLESALENKLEVKPKLIEQKKFFENSKTERKLIQEFINYKLGKQTKVPNLSRKILDILETYFRENEAHQVVESRQKNLQINTPDLFQTKGVVNLEREQKDQKAFQAKEIDFNNYNWN